PIKLRSVFMQAIAVVPLPIQLSNTVSPSFVYVLIRYSNKVTGFCVGCSRLILFALEIVRTVLGFFKFDVSSPLFDKDELPSVPVVHLLFDTPRFLFVPTRICLLYVGCFL